MTQHRGLLLHVRTYSNVQHHTVSYSTSTHTTIHTPYYHPYSVVLLRTLIFCTLTWRSGGLVSIPPPPSIHYPSSIIPRRPSLPHPSFLSSIPPLPSPPLPSPSLFQAKPFLPSPTVGPHSYNGVGRRDRRLLVAPAAHLPARRRRDQKDISSS